MKCPLKARLKSGDLTFGTWVTIGHTDVADILESLGFDWLVFDGEHAPLGPETLAGMIQAIDRDAVCPMVRVGALEPQPVKSALDMGAHGVVFPLVNSPADASRAVSFAKYPPAGVRGVAPRKASDYGRTLGEYLRTANDETTVIAQIETREALANLDGILSTPGIDVAFVGPSDLTMSLGLVDDRGNPKVTEAMLRVVAACSAAGKTPGVLAADFEEARRAVKMGFKFVGLGSDTRFLVAGARDFIRNAKGG